MKRYIALVACLSLFIVSHPILAADVNVILDNSPGSLVIKDSSRNTVASVDSTGIGDFYLLHNRATDFRLSDNTHGRGDPGAGRALVHAPGNQLTLNYAGDFTGGTNIYGSPVFIPNNVGIGSTNPISKLELSGSGGDTGVAIRFDETSNRQWALYPNGGIFRIKDLNAGSDYLTVQGGTGNIGIGTTNPLSKISVNDNGAANYGIYSLGSSTGVCGVSNSGYGVWGWSSSGLGIYGSSSSGFAGYFNGNSYFSGNVGIGTTAPRGKLDISTGGMNSYIECGAGSVYLGDYSNVANNVYQQINGDDPNSGFVFKNGTVQILNGNVGIGTTNPGALLEVVGNIKLGFNALGRTIQGADSSGSGTPLIIRSGSNTGGSYPAGNLSLEAGTSTSGGTYNGSILFSTAGTERMRVNRNGNIGIGTTNPLSPLHIYTSNGDAYAGLVIQKNGAKTLSINQGSSNKLNFTEPGVVDLMTVDFSGLRVGIGNASPSSGKLQVTTSSGTAIYGSGGGFGAELYGSSTGVYANGDTGVNAYGATYAGYFQGKLYVSTLSSNGTVYSNGSILTNTNPSSIRYKKDVKDLPIETDNILKLRPVSFIWKNNGQKDVGLIAEEVAKQVKDLTALNSAGSIEGVKYDKLPVYLLGVIKQQQKQINDQSGEIKQIKAENQDLQSRLKALEVRLAK